MPRQRFAMMLLALVLAPAALRAEPTPLKQPYFDSNGVKIHYVLAGKADGQAVVLIHGFTNEYERTWGPVVKALASDYRLIGIDCRGHGASEKPHDPKQYGPEMSEDVIRLLDHLKIQRAHLAGYSMGAAIAFQVAARHPDRVRSVILGGNGMPPPDSAKLYVAIAESLEQGKGFGPMFTALTPKDQPPIPEGQARAMSTFMLARNDGLALAAVMRGMAAIDADLSDGTLKSIKTPMRAIIGERDPIKSRVDALKARLPDLDVVVVPNGDHGTTRSSPEFVTGVKEFFDKHRAGK